MASQKGKVRIDAYDIIGKCLGKLEVMEYDGYHYDRTRGGDRMRHYYRVRCECGVTKLVQRGQLTSEIVHSCGCARRCKHER